MGLAVLVVLVGDDRLNGDITLVTVVYLAFIVTGLCKKSITLGSTKNRYPLILNQWLKLT